MRAAPTAPSASGHPKSAHPLGREVALRAHEVGLGGGGGELARAALVGGLDQRVHAGDGALEGAVEVAAEQPVAEEEGGEGVAGAVQVDGELGGPADPAAVGAVGQDAELVLGAEGEAGAGDDARAGGADAGGGGEPGRARGARAGAASASSIESIGRSAR